MAGALKGKSFLFIERPQLALGNFLTKEGAKVVFDPKEKFDCVVFYGPSEVAVTPFLYGQDVFKYTKSDFRKDKLYNQVFRSLPYDKHKLGILGGAHRLNVFNGGSIIQHATGHAGVISEHEIAFYDGSDVMAPTDHFQMMVAGPSGWELAWARTSYHKEGPGILVKYDRKGKDKDNWSDLEVVFYEHSQSLCIQPDLPKCNTPAKDSLLQLIRAFLDNQWISTRAAARSST